MVDMMDLAWKDRKSDRIVQIVHLASALEEVLVTFMDVETGEYFELDDESFVWQYEARGLIRTMA